MTILIGTALLILFLLIGGGMVFELAYGDL